MPQLHLWVENTGEMGDMLWTTAMDVPIVSERFADAIRGVGESGVQIVPTPLFPKRGKVIDGYSVLALNNGVSSVIQGFPNTRATSTIDVPMEVDDRFKAAGVSRLMRESAAHRYQSILAAQQASS